MKKNSIKKLTAWLAAATMVFGMCVTGVSASAATATEDKNSTSTVYLKPNANWEEAGARFAAHLWNGGGATTWVDATDADGDGYYEVSVPEKYTNLVFTRMNPATTDNYWDYMWNQTENLCTESGKAYVMTEDSWTDGQWKSFNTIYLKVNANWAEAGARFAAYLWNDGGATTWVNATKCSDNVYAVTVSEEYTNLVFTRMNPATADNNWDNKWDQTENLSVEPGKTYVMTEGSWKDGQWKDTDNQSTTVPATEPTTAPATEPTTAPATEPATAPSTEPATAPSTEPTTTPASSSTTYLEVNANWAEAGARFAAYLWNDNGATTWVDATKYSDNVYAVQVPEGYTDLVFTRMNPKTTDNSWDAMWNQTNNLKIESGKAYVMTDGSWRDGQWNALNTTYIKVNANWAEAGARFAAYLWNNGGATTWVNATKCSDNVYAVTVPEGYTNIIFTRMNSSTTDNSWETSWDQTNNLNIELGKTYVMTDGSWTDGEWK